MNQKELDALERVVDNYLFCESRHHQSVVFNCGIGDCNHVYHALQILNDFLIKQRKKKDREI